MSHTFLIDVREFNQEKFNARSLHQNLFPENFRVFRAKASRTIRESKRKSWKHIMLETYCFQDLRFDSRIVRLAFALLVLYTKIWKTFVFFVRKPAARFENQNVNPGNIESKRKSWKHIYSNRAAGFRTKNTKVFQILV